jgi:hypothetical protein
VLGLLAWQSDSQRWEIYDRLKSKAAHGPSQVGFSSSAKSINYIWDLNARNKWYVHNENNGNNEGKNTKENLVSLVGNHRCTTLHQWDLKKPSTLGTTVCTVSSSPLAQS